ncbi:13681_t:CDS:2 [Acaulospora morrowiae]|uniref:13681_t:CDS:1 n=1 Tax=Acaulospora morrowiae TaxID=94023 RepID=A0A9N9BR69_9GLOM|nr:13681_t:CDS:2 [Acaulospora morrowiae]
MSITYRVKICARQTGEDDFRFQRKISEQLWLDRFKQLIRHRVNMHMFIRDEIRKRKTAPQIAQYYSIIINESRCNRQANLGLTKDLEQEIFIANEARRSEEGIDRSNDNIEYMHQQAKRNIHSTTPSVQMECDTRCGYKGCTKELNKISGSDACPPNI